MRGGITFDLLTIVSPAPAQKNGHNYLRSVIYKENALATRMKYSAKIFVS